MTPRPVRRVVRSRDATLSGQQWPATLAPIAHVLERGLDLAQSTVVVGENGTGKSTFVEAVATAYGLSPEGGSTGAQHSTRPTESPLRESISLVRGPGASRWGYFLRAETMHGLFLDAAARRLRALATEATELSATSTRLSEILKARGLAEKRAERQADSLLKRRDHEREQHALLEQLDLMTARGPRPPD